jgi:DNA-directed RNA polymerase subunit M/transcription elongation factor TFIIS
MKNIVSDLKASSEEATIASREKTRECGECGQDKASYIQLLYPTGIVPLTEEKRMSCGKCGPKTKVKTMATKKKATKKKKK